MPKTGKAVCPGCHTTQRIDSAASGMCKECTAVMNETKGVKKSQRTASASYQEANVALNIKRRSNAHRPTTLVPARTRTIAKVLIQAIGLFVGGGRYPSIFLAKEWPKRARPSPMLKFKLNRQPYVEVACGRQQPPPGSVWAAGLHGCARRLTERRVRCSRRLEWLTWTTRCQ